MNGYAHRHCLLEIDIRIHSQFFVHCCEQILSSQQLAKTQRLSNFIECFTVETSNCKRAYQLFN